MRELDTFRRAMHVDRLHTVPTITGQTIGEHTANAIAIALTIAGYSSVDVNKLAIVTHLLEHDAAEIYTGDVPAPAKVENAELAIALRAVERKWAEENHIHSYPAAEQLTPEETAIAKAADWLDLMGFAIFEIQLGNQHMQEVYRNIRSYINSGLRYTVPGVDQIASYYEEQYHVCQGS